MSASELDQLVLVARLYYEMNQSQDAIAKQLQVSRPTVSRMLASARRRGIVNITIDASEHRNGRIEEALVAQYGLKSAVVVTPEGGATGPLDHLGRAAADYVTSMMTDGVIIGVGHGGSVAATARFLEPTRSFHATVIELVGSLGLTSATHDTAEIARVFAAAFGASRVPVPAPAFVRNAEVREVFVGEPLIATALEAMRRASIAVIGIGSWEPSIVDTHEDNQVLINALGAREPDAIRAAGGIGHICGVSYDRDGNALPLAEGRHTTVGIDFDSLRQIDTVVAVAGGVGKAPAIEAALRGGLIDVLITDAHAAGRVLELTGAPRP